MQRVLCPLPAWGKPHWVLCWGDRWIPLPASRWVVTSCSLSCTFQRFFECFWTVFLIVTIITRKFRRKFWYVPACCRSPLANCGGDAAKHGCITVYFMFFSCVDIQDGHWVRHVHQGAHSGDVSNMVRIRQSINESALTSCFSAVGTSKMAANWDMLWEWAHGWMCQTCADSTKRWWFRACLLNLTRHTRKSGCVCIVLYGAQLSIKSSWAGPVLWVGNISMATCHMQLTGDTHFAPLSLSPSEGPEQIANR